MHLDKKNFSLIVKYFIYNEMIVYLKIRFYIIE